MWPNMGKRSPSSDLNHGPNLSSGTIEKQKKNVAQLFPLLLYISFSFLQRVSGSTAGDLLYTTLFNTDLYHPSEIYLKVIYNLIDA